MASASAPDHEIIMVTPEMTELRRQCHDIRITVFVNEQGEFNPRFQFSSGYYFDKVSLQMLSSTSNSYELLSPLRVSLTRVQVG